MKSCVLASLAALLALTVGCAGPGAINTLIAAPNPYQTDDGDPIPVEHLGLEAVGERAPDVLRESLRRIVGESVSPQALAAFIADRQRHLGDQVELVIEQWQVEPDGLPPFRSLGHFGSAAACVVEQGELRRLLAGIDTITVSAHRVTVADGVPGALELVRQQAYIAGYDIQLDPRGFRVADPQIASFTTGYRLAFIPALTRSPGAGPVLVLALHQQRDDLVDYQELTVTDDDCLLKGCIAELPLVARRELDWQRATLRPREALLFVQPWLTEHGPRLAVTAICWQAAPAS